MGANTPTRAQCWPMAGIFKSNRYEVKSLLSVKHMYILSANQVATAVHVVLRDLKAVHKQEFSDLRSVGTSNLSSHPPTQERGRWRERHDSCRPARNAATPSGGPDAASVARDRQRFRRYCRACAALQAWFWPLGGRNATRLAAAALHMNAATAKVASIIASVRIWWLRGYVHMRRLSFVLINLYITTCLHYIRH